MDKGVSVSKLQVAIIWGYSRTEKLWGTHHQFWEATLREHPNIEVHRYNWDNWQTMPTGYDLYFFVDFHPSLFRVCHTEFHPRIFYWFDSFHHSFVYPAQIIDCFDRSYFSEYQAVKALNNVGVSKVSWLPAAYYPGVYRPIVTEKLHQYAFVGQPDDVVIRKGMTRKEFVEKFLSEQLRGYVGQGVYGDDVNRAYNETEVLLDRTIYSNIGTRFFETIGSGGFLLMNRVPIPNGMDELAMDGRHFVSYDDSYEDCLQKLRYYLEHREEREKIAKNGEAYFRKYHTYAQRFEKILVDLGCA
jgi:hypothetical protein